MTTWVAYEGELKLMETIRTTGMQSYPFGPPEAPPFYDKNSSELPSWPAGLGDGRDTRGQYLEEYLESNWTPAAIEEVVNRLNIKLQQEPQYSRKICNRLLAKSVHDRTADEALCLFLDDLTLNIRGSGNYVAAVEHLAWNESRPRSRLNCLRAVVRALKSGSVLPDELRVIVRTIPRIQTDSDMDKQSRSKDVVNWYRLMWNAIGRCDVFGHRDLDLETIGTWLRILQHQDSLEAMDLAKDIILGAQTPTGCSWIPMFITRWLNLAIELKAPSENYVANILRHLDPDIGSNYIANISETLASLEKSGRRKLLLEKWHDCLFAISDTKPLVLSRVWAKLDSPKTTSPVRVVTGESTKLPQGHRIVLRLWALRALSKHLPEGSLWQRREKLGDLPLLQLFDYYESVRTEKKTKQEKTIRKRRKGFLLSIMNAIQDLDLPSNGLLLSAVDVGIRKKMSHGRQKAIQQLEHKPMHFAEIFAELDTYNSIRPLFYNEFEKMIRQINVTSVTFIHRSIQLAATGDTHGSWTIMRLLQHHAPLKIALSKSWNPNDANQQNSSSSPANAETSPTTLVKSTPCPDPQKALDMIHNLAVAFASSKNISSRRSFHLVHLLYVFLKDHNAPIRPSLVRALYHAGIVRYQREGNTVAQAKYAYIMELVNEFEDPRVAEELLQGPQYGESSLKRDRVEF